MLWSQFGLFVVFTLPCPFLAQRWLRLTADQKRWQRERKFIGRVGRLMNLDDALGLGHVRLENRWWLASYDSPESIPGGAQVEVTDTDGAILIVRPLDRPETA